MAHGATTIDPICGMSVDPDSAGAHRSRDGEEYWFCCEGCAVAFDANAESAR
jgi:YHS domain-containing protein